MTTKTKSPFGKYVQAIRDSPTGLFNWRLIVTVAMYALGGMPKGEEPCKDIKQAYFANTKSKAGTKAARHLSHSSRASKGSSASLPLRTRTKYRTSYPLSI